MQSNFHRSVNSGVNRNFFFGSSKNDITIPNGSNVAQSHKFVSSNGQHTSTLIMFETKTPVSWNEARELVPTQGTIVTMCKAPVPELDGAMFNLLLNSLIASTKWIHTPGVQKPTFFKTSATGVTTVVDQPVPIPADVVINTNVSVTKAEKRDREIINLVTDDEHDEYGVPYAKLSPIAETQMGRRIVQMEAVAPTQQSAAPAQMTISEPWL